MKLFFTLFFSLFILNCAVSQPQNGGIPTGRTPSFKLTGSVTGGEKPIEFAAISLFRMPKDTMLAASLTDANGMFLLDKLPPGNYKLRISYVGFVTKFIENIALNRENNTLDLGKIRLEVGKNLKQLEIVGQQSFMENGADRRIFNISQMPTAQNGNALQVLENLPNVEINQETGGVEMRGSGGITFLIDGKPSGITGADRTAILEQIPANAIDRIEIITNPSAKFDPDGTTGIINIVLKKNKNLGVNGSVNAGYGTRRKYESGANIGLRNSKMALNANVSYKQGESWVQNRSDRQFFVPNPDTFLRQRGYSEITNNNSVLKLAMDYYLSAKTTLGVSVLGSYQSRTNSSTRNYTEYTLNALDTNVFRQSVRLGKEPQQTKNIDFNFSLQHDFSPEKQLVLLATRTQGTETGQYFYDETYKVGNNKAVKQQDTGFNNNRTSNAQLDFVHKLKDNTKYEAGAKMIFRDVNSALAAQIQDSTLKFVVDAQRANDFSYQERIYAVYNQYEGKIKDKLGYQVGLRLEQAFTQSQLFGDSARFVNNYFSYFPTLNLFKKFNKKHDFRLGYARRINRPNIQNLNPFTNYADRVNLRVGNPYLRPEYIDAFELSYFRNIKKGNFTATAYYRHTNNAILRTFAVKNGLTIISFDNVGTGDAYGLELSGQLNFKDRVSLSPSLNLNKTLINGGAGFSNSGWVYGARLNSNIKLWKSVDAQVSGRYRSPEIVPQGTINMKPSLDVSLRQKLFAGNATLALGCRDVFDTQGFEVRGNAATFSQVGGFKRQTRVATINFTYRLGSQNNSERKKSRAQEAAPQEGGGGDF